MVELVWSRSQLDAFQLHPARSEGVTELTNGN